MPYLSTQTDLSTQADNGIPRTKKITMRLSYPVATLLPTLVMLVLCNQRPFVTHSITFALLGFVLLITTPSDWKAASHMCHSDLGIPEFSLFWLVKKWSIAAAYFVCVLMSLFPASKAVGSLFSLGLFVNVLEAAVLAIVESDWVVASALLLFAPFFPVMCVSATDKLWTHKEASFVCGIFPMRMRMDAHTYMRWHYVVISALYLFNDHFGGDADSCSSRIYLTSTCIMPLISMEINAALDSTERSPCRDFMIRGMGLVWGVLIDSTIDQHFFNKLDDALLPAGYNTALRANGLLRNGLQAAFIVLGLGFFHYLFPSGPKVTYLLRSGSSGKRLKTKTG